MTSSSMLPNTPRRMGQESARHSTPTATVEMASTLYSWAALRWALSWSRRPMYWLATTAPPVASAARIWIIRMFRLSTLDTAASPTPATIRVSAMPIVTLRVCSKNSGQISATSADRVKSGAFACVAVPIPGVPPSFS